MAPPRVLDWREINEDSIVFQDSKQNKHNGMTVPVKWRDRNGTLHPIVVQTPVMSLPFGVSDKVLEQYGRKIEASLSFPGYAPQVSESGDVTVGWDTPEMSDFHAWFAQWDELNPKIVAAKSKEFFRKQISDLVVQELYKPNIKPSSLPDKYSPTLRCKIPVSSDQPTTDFFNVESTGPVETNMSRIRTGARVIALLKTTGLWFAGKSFGMNFHVIQMVQLASDKFEGCAISVPESLLPPPEMCPKQPVAFDPGTPPAENLEAEKKRKLLDASHFGSAISVQQKVQRVA